MGRHYITQGLIQAIRLAFMKTLKGKVALVTGASRGVGKGIAMGLGEAGATVYVTGRTSRQTSTSEIPGTIEDTAEALTHAGGEGIAVVCDHANDEDVAALFERMSQHHGSLDILVNGVWGGYEHMVEQGAYTWELPFWQQPLWRWDAMFQTGIRAHYSASRLAAPLMIEQGNGLIVNLSYWAAQKYMANVAYGVAKAATDRMTVDMAHELRPHNVAVVSLYPGLVRTERVRAAAAFLDLSNSESPLFVGRAVVALACDERVMEKTGQVVVAAELGLEYGFTDVNGTQPRPLTLMDA